MQLLQDKTAVITGARRGIGRAIALKFALEGADIAFTDIVKDENFENLEKDLLFKGIKAIGYVSDAGSFSESEALIKKVLDDFGKIDILVNNAGITRDNLLLRMTEEQWDTVIKVNLKSVFNLTKAVLPIMIRQRRGSIINLSSVVGIEGNEAQTNYSASKAGIIGFTKSLAKEVGSRNIRSNAIAPGFILTEMTEKVSDAIKQSWIAEIPMKRAGTPEEVANVALFLASDLSSYINGQVISVCGAWHT